MDGKLTQLLVTSTTQPKPARQPDGQPRFLARDGEPNTDKRKAVASGRINPSFCLTILLSIPQAPTTPPPNKDKQRQFEFASSTSLPSRFSRFLPLPSIRPFHSISASGTAISILPARPTNLTSPAALGYHHSCPPAPSRQLTERPHLQSVRRLAARFRRRFSPFFLRQSHHPRQRVEHSLKRRIPSSFFFTR